MNSKLQSLINHIVFVVDASGSMSSISNDVVKVFDNQIKKLAAESKALDQETRVSVYFFNTKVSNLVYDKDVLRLPSLHGHYSANGGTALIEGTMKAIEDAQKSPELYGDHATIIYVLTDGDNTEHPEYASKLSDMIAKLPDNYTLACFVPNSLGVMHAKRYGFPKENIIVWSTDGAGADAMGDQMSKATSNFMAARTTGVRGTKNLFSLNTNLSSTAIKTSLTKVNASTYETLIVRQYDDGKAIKDFVESWTKLPYRAGSSYYQLSKPEKIQPSKNIMIRNNIDANVYGGSEAREVLGLPNTEVKVSPANYKEWTVFVQSSSVNRKLVKDTHLLVMK